MRRPNHRSTYGVENLKDCIACGEPIRETATRCRHCQADQTPWRRTSNWVVPVLGLVVAILALLPDIVPPVVQTLARPRAEVVLVSAGVEQGNLHLLFENGGNERGMVGDTLVCTLDEPQPQQTGQAGAAMAAEDATPVRPLPHLRIRNTLEHVIAVEETTGVTFRGKTFVVVQDRGEARHVPLGALAEAPGWLDRHLADVGHQITPGNTYALECRLSVRSLNIDVAALAGSGAARGEPDLTFRLSLEPDGMVRRVAAVSSAP